jgi:hypothetical protein
VSEQVRTAGPDGAEQPPPDRKKRKGLVVAIVGGFLTASAVVLALNGGPPFIKKDATLSERRVADPRPCNLRTVGKPREGMLRTHLLRWQSGRPPVPRVELLGSALAAISRLSLP